jgi:transposase InsO family protein
MAARIRGLTTKATKASISGNQEAADEYLKQAQDMKATLELALKINNYTVREDGTEPEPKRRHTHQPPLPLAFKEVPLLSAPHETPLTVVRLAEHLQTLKAFAEVRGHTRVKDFRSYLLASCIRHAPLIEYITKLPVAATHEDYERAVLNFFGKSAVVNEVDQELSDLQQGQTDLNAYYHKFKLLTRIRSIDCDHSQMLNKFVAGINNSALRDKVETQRHAMLESYPTLEDVFRLALAFHKKELPPETKRSADAHSASSSSGGIINSSHTGHSRGLERAKQATKPKDPLKFCKYHPFSKSHTTSECQRGARVEAAKASSLPSKEAPQQHPASSSAPAKPDDKSDDAKDPCAHCRKPGHTRATCWSLHPELRGSHHTDLAFTAATILAHPALFSLQRHGRATDVAPEPFLLAVTVADTPVEVFPDTGASCSFMSSAFANKNKINWTPCETRIDMERGHFLAMGKTEPVITQAGSHLRLISYLICDTLNNAPVYLGRPDLERLQVLKWCLPEPGPLQSPLHSQEEKIEAQPHEDVHPDDRQAYQVFLKELEPLLTRNATVTGFAMTPDVELNLIDNKPVWLSQYSIPEAHKTAVREQIARWLEKGKIRKVRSLSNLPITTALKQNEDGTTKVRVCLDPRSINNRLVSDSFTIPNIQDIHRSFHGCHYFSELDCEDAFLQLKLRDSDQDRLAFTFDDQQYCFVGAPYGLKPMSSIFQRYVADIFKDMPYVKVYIDNIIIASKTWAEHKLHVHKAIERMNAYNLKLNQKPGKLKLARRHIKILGKRISAHGVAPDPDKVKKINKWPFPADCKALQSFLGVVNYLRPHIAHLSHLEEPLNKARSDQEAYDREIRTNKEKMMAAFDIIKQAIASAPLLRYPDYTRPFHIAPDASRCGVGAVLYQTTPEQDAIEDTSVTGDNIVMITSRSLTSYERNYSTFKLELLAVVNALREFRDFVLGNRFHLHTDHKALTFVLNGKGKQQHPTINGWISEICDYDFTITHTPGHLNYLPDSLSRLYSKSTVWGVSTAKNLSEKEASIPTFGDQAGGMLVAQPAAQLRAMSLHDSSEKTPTDVKRLTKEELVDLLGKRIPPPEERPAIISAAHARGHYGPSVVISHLFQSQGLWWPSLRADVVEALKHCTPCLKYNIKKRGYHPIRSPNPALPGEWWQMDLIVMPECADGYQYILTVLDLFSSYLITRPLQSKSAPDVARALYEIICAWGPPKIIQSDGGSEFVNSILKEISELFDIDLRISTPYHKQSTGSIERVNLTLAVSLRKLLRGSTATWHTQLPAATYYYNTTVRSLHKSSPYAIMFAHSVDTMKGGEQIQDITFHNWDKRVIEFFDDHKRWLTEIREARVLCHGV